MRRAENEVELSAEAERELRALDDALAGRPVDAELDGVARLAWELRMERPKPGEEFAEGLDRRAAVGFGLGRDSADTAGEAGRRQGDRGGVLHLWRGSAGGGRQAIAIVGAAAALLVATVIGVSALQGASDPLAGPGGDDSAAGSADAGSGADAAGAAAESALPSSGAAEALSAGPEGGRLAEPGSGGELAPNRANRKVESAAEITLSTEPDRVREVSDEVIEVSDDHGGIVVSSNVRERNDGDSIGRLDLAIPSGELSGFLADVSDLAEVESRTDSSIDITEDFVRNRERLREAEAERDAILERLADPADAAEAGRLRERLRAVRDRIERQRTRLAKLDQRAELSRVSVTVNGNGSGAGGWTLGDAVDDALDVLRALAGAGIVAAAVLVPLGLLLWIGWLLSRGARRRARERALDEA